MSKGDFVQAVADLGEISAAEAKQAVELVFGAIEEGLKQSKKDGKFAIGTFGTFAVSHRTARMGRNPQTGQAMRIEASKSLRFKPAMNLKRAAGC